MGQSERARARARERRGREREAWVEEERTKQVSSALSQKHCLRHAALSHEHALPKHSATVRSRRAGDATR